MDAGGITESDLSIITLSIISTSLNNLTYTKSSILIF